MLHIAGSLPAMRKSNTKVRKKMHICKSPRRKIARKCIFCAGVPAYARIRAGATAQKSNSAAIFFFGRNLAKMPGIALQYLRREPARREGACRSYERREQKKQPGLTTRLPLHKFLPMIQLSIMRYRKPQNRRTHIRITMRSTKAIQTYRATR